MKNTEIAVFGGTFNPPTLAHQEIIQACLDQPMFDEVWVMPSGIRGDKRDMADEDARIAMLSAMKKQVFDDDKRLHISNFELTLPRPTETIKTVGALAAAHVTHRFWYVYGADSYQNMPSWRGGAYLRENLHMLVMPREGYDMPEENENIRHLTFERREIETISSTTVRETISMGGSVGSLVCDAVKTYIESRSLYQAQV